VFGDIPEAASISWNKSTSWLEVLQNARVVANLQRRSRSSFSYLLVLVPSLRRTLSLSLSRLSPQSPFRLINFLGDPEQTMNGRGERFSGISRRSKNRIQGRGRPEGCKGQIEEGRSSNASGMYVFGHSIVDTCNPIRFAGSKPVSILAMILPIISYR